MRTYPNVPDDRIDVYDFSIRQCTFVDPPVSHRHNSVEIAFIDIGSMACLIGDRKVVVPAKRLAVLLGARPHMWIDVEEDTTRTFIDIPLTWFIHWGLPAPFVREILSGSIVVEEDESRSDADHFLMDQWTRDVNSSVVAKRQVVMLELEARLWRLALGMEGGGSSVNKQDITRNSRGDFTKAASMVSYIGDHYQEPISAQQIAESVGLHPNYAMSLFHSRTGFTLMDYVSSQRISHAQLLLATTNTRIVDVAFHAGFGSASRFYSAFKRVCGQTPSDYRRALRGRT